MFHLMLVRLPISILFVIATLGLCPADAPAAVEFNRDIRPILADNCFECHGPDAGSRKAGLRLDLKDGLFSSVKEGKTVAPGRPDESRIYQRMSSTDADERMPPVEAHRRPTLAQIDLVRQWIESGAVYEEHWAFTAPGRRALPGIDSDWVRNGIDLHVLKGLEGEDPVPNGDARRETLIRRLSLDLRGLPPTIEEVDTFLADERPDAYERIVESFLASPRYGEHLAWSWMEAARFSDTDGFQSDARRHMWRWREWVIEAFNNNMPYDQFTIEQLAGDLLLNPTLDQILATGFNRNHRYDKGSGTIQAESVFENAMDRLETTSTVWLGLTVGCARCHDHKFDPISSREYYEMLAFFDKVPENGQAILFNSHPRMKTPTMEQGKTLDALEKNVASARKALAAHEAKIASLQRAWEQRIDSGWDGKLLPDGLASHFPLDGPEPKGKFRNGRVKFVRGVKGRAMKFDGEAYYEFDNTVGNLWARDKFTVSFWFKLADLEDGVLLSELDDPQDYRMGTVIEMKDGKLRFMLSARWNYAVSWFELKQKPRPNRWYHFAVTCDGRVQMLAYHVYLNGRETPIRVIQDSAVDGKKIKEPLYLGYSELWPGFRGAIDELRFYRRDLSAEEVGVLSVRQSVPTIARKPINKRSNAEGDLMRSQYLRHAAKVDARALVKRLRDAEKALQNFRKEIPTTMVMVEDPSRLSHMRIQGQFDQLGERVRASTPAVLPAFDESLPRNRLGFARWLVDPRNPLTARVTVNRVWQHFFGRGFVDAPENFGMQSARPRQLELLNWLSHQFVDSGWDLKELVRSIVTSSTYRQDSRTTAERWSEDPANQLLARGPRHRLSAAVIRDQALALGGLLEGSVGGDSVFPHQPKGLWRLTSNRAYQPSKGKDLYRRSLYTYWRRAIAPPSMFLFDAPDREFCNVAVKRTNTPLQALAALNERGFVEAARGLGMRMYRQEGFVKDRLRFGFRLVSARNATEREIDLLIRAWRSHRAEFAADRSAAVELANPEPARNLNNVDLAAYTAVANVLLNLDKTLTKE
ncbi:MAG: hypothetical protein CMO80_09190 [Verrucomicrobiales bacterium]|nr:hypothetical protein [Verrucomicrobiales bacterium]